MEVSVYEITCGTMTKIIAVTEKGNKMSRDKQIEEMAKDLENHTCMSEYQAEIASRMLYNAGYRKAPDVVNEIIEVLDDLYPKINDILNENLKDFSPSYTREFIFALVDILQRKIVEKIKTKYESEGEG